MLLLLLLLLLLVYLMMLSAAETYKAFNNELERVWKEAVVVIFMKGLRKTMKNLIQDNWSAD
jgi:hypothetical protein